ncbi:hypothetical protein CFC21_021642 [Triticum aestivum]|uniref:Uncharacterized protein n=2 Tax=Triticum aestivum TaxID=4565 RepID=A0A3B6C2G2_WHEAT|nr:hypothetical protein CFC21_021642 [Triticum aestivum]
MAHQRRISQFGSVITNYCWMLLASSGFFLGVFAVTTIAPVHPRLMIPVPGTADCSTACPIDCVCSPSTSTTVADRLKYDIAIWNRFLIAFCLSAVYFVFLAKQRVDAAAKAEDRAASDEDKAYKSALEDLSAPRTAVKEAAEAHALALEMFPPPAEGALDPHVIAAEKTHCDAVRAFMSATEEAEKKRPIVGIARMGDVERRIVRGLFFLSVLVNMGAGICAAGAFFRSVELQMGNPAEFGTLVVFAVPGVPMIVSHLFCLFVAVKED